MNYARCDLCDETVSTDELRPVRVAAQYVEEPAVGPHIVAGHGCKKCSTEKEVDAGNLNDETVE